MNGRSFVLGLLGLAVISVFLCGLLGLGTYVVTRPAEVVDNSDNSPVVTDPDSRRVDISCVQRANFGEEIGYGTITWDAETRVWILEDFVCDGPYCYTYDACRDPEAAIELQPFYLGYELSPVTGEKFDLCYDFKDSS